MPADLFPPTIDDALSEIRRELDKRRSVYPRLVANGTMTQRTADLQTARLKRAQEILLEAKQNGVT